MDVSSMVTIIFIVCYLPVNNAIPARMLSIRFASARFTGAPASSIEGSMKRAEHVGFTKFKKKIDVTEFKNDSTSSKRKEKSELNYEQKVPCWKLAVVARKMHAVAPRYIGSNQLDNVAYAAYKQMGPITNRKDQCKLGVNFRMEEKKDCSLGTGKCDRVKSHNVYLETDDEE